MAGRRQNPGRGTLTRERVLAGALELADAHGTDALSMRRLAEHLGFEVMALYNHVRNKDEMLAGLVELVVAEWPPPSSAGGWRASVRASFVAAQRSLATHRWAAALWVQQRSGPARLAYNEALLRTLREAGFSPLMAHYAYHALYLHLIGFTQQSQQFPSDPRELGAAAARFVATLPEGAYPYLVEHMQLHVDEVDEGSDFEFILDLVLDGLDRARRRDRRAGPAVR